MKRLITVAFGCYAALAASQAFGSLVVNLRVAGGFTDYDISAHSIGDTITIEVWAAISGANATSTDDGLNNAFFGILSSNADTAHIAGGITGQAFVAPFNSVPESVAGTIADRNADGVADLRGASTTNTTGWPKAAATAGTFVTGGGSTGQQNGSAWEFHLADAIFTITDIHTPDFGETAFLRLNPSLLAPVPAIAASRALWTEDGIAKDGSTGSITAGTSVLLILQGPLSPEPSSLALALCGVAGIGLYARRWKRNIIRQPR